MGEQGRELIQMRCHNCGDDFWTPRWEAELVCPRCLKTQPQRRWAREMGLTVEHKQGE